MTPEAVDAWLVTLSRLWRLERDAQHARFVAERAQTPLAERVARGWALADLVVEDTEPAAGGRVLLWLAPRRTQPGTDPLRHLRIGPGDPVRLWRDQPDGPGAVLGVVSRRRATRVGVVVDDDLPDELGDGGTLHLDRDDPQATFERGMRGIERTRAAPAPSDLGRLRAVLCLARPPRFGPETPLEVKDPDLNEPQRAAVRRALAAEDVALIHGPPGTGKTRTLVEVIRQAVARGQRVLATAASNVAVDNLGERLVAAGVDVVRLGHPARIAPALEAHGLDALLEQSEAWGVARRWTREAHTLRRETEKKQAKGRLERGEGSELFREVRRMLKDARDHLRHAERAIVDRASVVVATAAGADADVLGDELYDLVVLDEATQAPDPIALVAIARAKRLVLAGDPCQLPPTVIDREAERAGLGTTFFERLREAAGPDALRLLTVQHRMHRTIMAWPSEEHYASRLEAHPSVADHLLEELEGVRPDELRPGPLVLIDTAGTGWEEVREGEDPSTHNPGHAERVVKEVRRLLSRGLAPADLGVITPYDAQARKLRDALQDEVAAGLEVGSIDGFQGREKEAIVVDLVRSNDRGQVGFLADVRRMNVALTRARRLLLLVADSATLGEHPYHRRLLDAVGALGEWLSAYADEAEPLPS